MKPEYVLDLHITAAVLLAASFRREEARRRMAFVVDVQVAVGSLLVKKSGIEEYLNQLGSIADGG